MAKEQGEAEGDDEQWDHEAAFEGVDEVGSAAGIEKLEKENGEGLTEGEEGGGQHGRPNGDWDAEGPADGAEHQ